MAFGRGSTPANNSPEGQQPGDMQGNHGQQTEGQAFPDRGQGQFGQAPYGQPQYQQQGEPLGYSPQSQGHQSYSPGNAPQNAHQNSGPGYQQQGYQHPGQPGHNYGPPQPQRKKRHPFRMGCLGLLGLILLIVIITVATQSGDKKSDSSSANSGSTGHSSAQSGPGKSEGGSSQDDAKSDMDKAYGTFTPISKSGSSATVIDVPSGAKGAVIKATYQGNQNFSIAGIDSNNQPTADLLVNTIGSYSGESFLDATNSLGNAPTKLKIEGNGSWTLKISPVSSAPTMSESGVSGKGDAVYLYTGGATTLTAKHTGSANFIATQHGSGMDALSGVHINEIGNYSGQAAFIKGTQPFSIQADGTWSFKP